MVETGYALSPRIFNGSKLLNFNELKVIQTEDKQKVITSGDGFGATHTK
jgi:hypothetical protein